MTGKELIQDLDKRIGTNYTFAVGDVIWHGTLKEHSRDEVSAKYATENVTFVIFPDKNYRLKFEYGIIDIKEVKN